MNYCVTVDNMHNSLLPMVLRSCSSRLDSLDEIVDEHLNHVVVLCASLQDSLDKFSDEQLYCVVIPVPFFLDYQHEVVI